MKVLLINPPQTFYQGSDLPSGNLPLGLMYIAAVLEKAGHEVTILDAFMNDPLVWKSGDTIRIGMSPKKIQEEIQKRNPDIVGVSNPFTSQVENAIEVCDLAKGVNRKIVTVVGGPHVTAVAVEFLKGAKNADVAVVGEGEYAMLDIANCLQEHRSLSNVLGSAFRKGKTIIQNSPRPFVENLDELPYPAYHLVNMELYLAPKKI